MIKFKLKNIYIYFAFVIIIIFVVVYIFKPHEDDAFNSAVNSGAPTFLSAATNSNSAAVNDGYEIELTGTLRLVGSAPIFEYVLTSNGVDYYIEADKEEIDKLKSFQGKKARTYGTVMIKKYVYPDPVYNHEKNFLFPETLEIINN